MRVSQISKFFKIVVLALCMMMMNVRISSAAEECSQICIAETKKGERPEKLDVDKACKPTEDLKAWCNVGCMCQAMSAAMRSSPPYFGFLANHPVAPLVGGGVVSNALQPAFGGGALNPLDSVCLALQNPGWEQKDNILEAMTGKAPTTKTTQSAYENPNWLGESSDCMDLCFRISAYIQQSQDGYGFHCALFSVIPATQKTDPPGIPGLNWNFKEDTKTT